MLIVLSIVAANILVIGICLLIADLMPVYYCTIPRCTRRVSGYIGSKNGWLCKVHKGE